MAVLDLTQLEVNIPSRDFGTYTTHLSAPPKFGKSEWCTYFDRPLILDFEEGTAGKVVYRVQVTKWSEVKNYVKQLTKDPSLKERFKTICLDTTNYALEACKQWCIEQYMANNPDKVITTFNQIPWGGGWELLTKEFKAEINKLKRAGYGVVLVSHTKDKVFDKESEAEHTKTVPDLSDKERNMISAMADFLLLGEFERVVITPAKKDGQNKVIEEAVVETKRVLHLRTNDEAEAGFRWKDCPETIDFDFETFKEVFGYAVEKEISSGLKKFGLTESKAEEIREKLDVEVEKVQQETFEAEKLEDLQAEIKKLVDTKKAEGVKVSAMKEALAPIGVNNPLKVEDVETAKTVIKVLSSL